MDFGNLMYFDNMSVLSTSADLCESKVTIQIFRTHGRPRESRESFDVSDQDSERVAQTSKQLLEMFPKGVR